MRPIAFICPKIPPSRDGVGDYTYCLASEIAKTRPVAIITTQSDLPAPDPSLPALQILHWDGRGLRTLQPILDRLHPTFINVQWVPFLWGKWGINFALPWMVVRLRLAGYRVVTTVHEPYVAFDRWKTFPMALLQRLELWLLILGSAKVAVSISAWTRKLQAQFFWKKRDIFWLPVGSAISRVGLNGDERAEIRRGLGVGADDLLVAMFNPGGAGKMVDLAAKAWRAIKLAHPTASLLLIGCQKSDPPSARFEMPDRVLCTGYLEPTQVSRLLSCADIFLAPFVDGISARRSSVIAAIEHGLPIVSTKGRLTDMTLFDGCPVLLVAVSDEGAFVTGAERLAGDSVMRQALRGRLMEFHRDHFSWPAIASPLLAAVES